MVSDVFVLGDHKCGAKHSSPGDKFQKSEGPHTAWPIPSEINILKAKSYPNEAFSILTNMISVVDSNGAKHFPPGGKFQKSEGPPSAMAGTSFSLGFLWSNRIQI